MLRGWTSRIFERSRADARVVAAGRRRLRGSRGAAFLEFALLAPFFLMVCSLMVETAVFWDASVMANHCAWSVGRILKVKAAAKDGTTIFKLNELGKSKDKKEGEEKGILEEIKETGYSGINKLINRFNFLGDQRNFLTVMLMSTCSIGYVGVPEDDLKNLFKTVVSEPLDDLKGVLTNWIKSFTGDEAEKDRKIDFKTISSISDLMSIGEVVKTALLNFVADKILQPIINAVFDKVLKKVTDKVEELLQKAGVKLEKLLEQEEGNFSSLKHYGHNLHKALQRVAHLGKDQLVLVDTANSDDRGIHFLNPQNAKLSYHPALKGQTSGMKGQLALIRVQWPMESDWLFPLFWGGTRTKGMGVWASGTSLVLLEPTLTNKDLLSGAKPTYEMPKENEADDFNNFADEMKEDLELELFLMRYRNARETLTMSSFFLSIITNTYLWRPPMVVGSPIYIPWADYVLKRTGAGYKAYRSMYGNDCEKQIGVDNAAIHQNFETHLEQRIIKRELLSDEKNRSIARTQYFQAVHYYYCEWLCYLNTPYYRYTGTLGPAQPGWGRWTIGGGSHFTGFAVAPVNTQEAIGDTGFSVKYKNFDGYAGQSESKFRFDERLPHFPFIGTRVEAMPYQPTDPTTLIKALQALGYGQDLPENWDATAALEAARIAGDEALATLRALRFFVDRNIQSLDDRLKGESADSAQIVIDGDAVKELMGSEELAGDKPLSAVERAKKQWELTKKKLAETRLQLNALARDLSAARVDLEKAHYRVRIFFSGASGSAMRASETAYEQSAYYMCAKPFNDVLLIKPSPSQHDPFAPHQEHDQREADAHDEQEARAYAQNVEACAQAVETFFEQQLQPGLEAVHTYAARVKALAEVAGILEMKIGQLLSLESAQGLDPTKVPWRQFGEGLAPEGDAGKDPDMDDPNSKEYWATGEQSDKKGDGPWNRK